MKCHPSQFFGFSYGFRETKSFFFSLKEKTKYFMQVAIDMYKKYSKKKKINDYFFLLINQNIIYDPCACKKNNCDKRNS
jgi:hypothetical protein